MKEKLFCSDEIMFCNYMPPVIKVEMIYLEQGIAENSTTVTPGDDGGDVSVGDWGNGGEIGGNIDW